VVFTQVIQAPAAVNDNHPYSIDGGSLVLAKRASAQAFREQVDRYRRAGFSDAEIVAAMAAMPGVINPVGRARRQHSLDVF
jgi:hypothetical protein